MPGSIGSKILSWLNNLFKNISSPLSGFDVMDVKAKEDGDSFSSLFQFQNNEDLKDERTGEAISDIGGNAINLNVLLKAINGKTVLNPILSEIASLGQLDAVQQGSDLLNLLLGKDRVQGEDIDNTLDGAKQRGKDGKHGGLLGLDLTKDSSYVVPLTYKGKDWSYYSIAYKYFKYSLECVCPGKDYGAIENQELTNCSGLISEYLAKVEVIKNESEVQIDINILVKPILVVVQQELRDYYEKAYTKLNENNSNTDEEVSEDQNQNDQQNSDNSGENPTEDTTQQTGDDNGMNTDQTQTASKHIDVTLRKITATSEFEMTAINANYSPSAVLTDMDEILGQPEFIQALPEELTTYSIDVDDDGFDIEPCEECKECNPCESLCEVFKAGIRAYRNLYILHWMSHGNDMMKLHNLSEEMYEELQSEIDTIGELLVEKQGTVPQLDFPCDYIPVQQYDFQTGLDQIKSLVQMYIDCIDYAYCNQDSDVQSTLDEWLRYWNKQLNYFVKGQEV